MRDGGATASRDREALGPYHSPGSTLAGLSTVYFLLFLSQAIWRATLPTVAVDKFALDGGEMGFLFSLSYLPGVLCFLIGLAATRVQLYRLVSLGCALLSTGFIVAGVTGVFSGIATATLLVAIGFTVFYTTANAVCLISGPEQTVATSLGRMKSLGPLSALVAAIIIIGVFAPGLGTEVWRAAANTDSVRGFLTALILFEKKPQLDFTTLHTLLLLLASILLLAAWKFARGPGPGRRAAVYGRLQIVRLLLPYYWLNFLAGCRSAIFQAFALFVLIRDFHLPLHATAALVFGGNFSSFLGYRCIGRALADFRHRTVLTAVYAMVTCNFLGFWYLLEWSGSGRETTLLALCGLFLVDSLLFGVSIVTDSYLRTIRDYSSYVGDIGTGMTFFYLAAMVMSLVGGALLDQVGNHAFLLGALVCMLAMISGGFMRSGVTARPAM